MKGQFKSTPVALVRRKLYLKRPKSLFPSNEIIGHRFNGFILAHVYWSVNPG